jgi:hypothetical protein
MYLKLSDDVRKIGWNAVRKYNMLVVEYINKIFFRNIMFI